MGDHDETARAVMRLAHERPEWIAALRAACVTARTAEDFSGDFAGAWVLDELERQNGTRWLPGLRTLATYGLIEKSGPSTRGGRRAYYRMPDRQGVEMALAELARRTAGAAPKLVAGGPAVTVIYGTREVEVGITEGSRIDLIRQSAVAALELPDGSAAYVLRRAADVDPLDDLALARTYRLRAGERLMLEPRP
jgi:hypothetical protein